MKPIKRTLLAAAVGSLLCAATFAAAGVSIKNTEIVPASSAYWTEDRVKEAKPMPMGTVSGAADASFGTSGLDFTRSRIMPQKANKTAVYKTVGKLYFTVPGQGNFQCSASVIRKRVIVTAAHCMYSDGVGYHTNWIFIPAFDGSLPTLAAQRPLGTWDWNFAVVPQNWIDTGGALPNNTDFGVLVLNDQSFDAGPPISIYQNTGKLKTAVNHLSDTHVTMLGYPCNFDSCNIMQRVDSSDGRPASPGQGNNAFEYGSDMTGGSSGGPWVENFGAGAAPQGSSATRNAVVGVTSYIYTDPAVLIEGASQFNADFTGVLNEACNAAPGNC